MRRIYIFLLLVSFAKIAVGQTERFQIEPLSNYRVLERFSTTKQPEGARPDSINLPFVEDFSYAGPFPDQNLWLDNKVFINATMSGSAPSVGVATFDAIDSNGKPYGTVGDTGTNDTLTSNYINLRDFVGTDGAKRLLGATDSVYMSFFLEPKGLSYAPDELDSMLLEFRDNAGNWVKMRSFLGIKTAISLDSIPPFTFYALPITDARFFYGKFQFRFRNFGRLGGAYEQWHLDYIKIAPNRRAASLRALDDVAFTELPKPILRRYTSMPWKQAKPQLAVEIQDTFNAKFFNHFATAKNPTNTNASVKASDGTIAVGNITILDAVNIPASSFLESIKKTYPSTLRGQLSNIAATERLDVTTEYTLQIEGQEGKDTAKAALRNDKVVGKTTFANYFAYDDGTAELQFSATGDAVQTAIRFHANVSDTLRGIQFYFPHINGDAPTDATFNLKIWKDSLNTTPIFTQSALKPFYLDNKADTLQGFTSYRLETKLKKDTFVIVPANTDFYIGWQNVGDVKIPIGLDRNNLDKTQYLYQFIDGSWQPITALTTRKIGAIMVRPVIGSKVVQSSSTLAVNELPLSELMTVYPNPASDRLFFDVKKGVAEDYEISIFNLIGRLEKREILRGSDISLADLPTGVYVLQVRELKSNRVAHLKLAVQK